jgi:hypothetical protein
MPISRCACKACWHHFRLLTNFLSEPFRWKVRFDEFLNAFAPSQAQPQGAALFFHTQVDVEKRAAQAFSSTHSASSW